MPSKVGARFPRPYDVLEPDEEIDAILKTALPTDNGMVQELPSTTPSEIVYPDSDGQSMAANTKEFRWIFDLKENLENFLAGVPNVWVAGDLRWYTVEGNPKICQAPNIMVVFDRPKGDRGSYKQWEEDNIPPQVVFEIIPPEDWMAKISDKTLFYDCYGVEEYYLYDLDNNDLVGYLRSGKWLEQIEEINGWVSPRLGIRFEVKENTVEFYCPNRQRFLTSIELDGLKEQERQCAEA